MKKIENLEIENLKDAIKFIQELPKDVDGSVKFMGEGYIEVNLYKAHQPIEPITA